MTNYQPESNERIDPDYQPGSNERIDPNDQSSVETRPFAPKPAPRKVSGKMIGGLITLALVAVIGVGGFIAVRTLFTAKQNIPQLLAGDTQFYASLNPNLSAVSGAQNIQEAYRGLFDEVTSGGDAAQQMQDQFGLNFKNDIQPWIGTEMAVGVRGVVVDGLDELTMGEAPSFDSEKGELIAVLATRDRAASDAALLKVRAKAESENAKASDEQYKNVTITSLTEDGKVVVAYATFQDYVLAANKTQVIKDLVDRAATKQNTLAANPRFQTVIAGLPATAIGYVFADGSAISQNLEQVMRSSMAQLPTEQQEQMEKSLQTIRALEGLGTSISVVEQGIALDAVVKFDLTKVDEKTKTQFDALKTPATNAILAATGQQALSVLGGIIPATTKQQILDAINEAPDAKQQVVDFEDETGISLERDILEWFEGEVAIVVLPVAKDNELGLPATGYFALRTPKKDAALAGLKKIEEAVNKASGSDQPLFSDATIGGQSWRVAAMEGVNFGGYSFVGDTLVIGVADEALNGAATGKDQPLTNTDAYKAVAANLPNPNGGISFINVPAVLTLLDSLGVTTDGSSKSDEEAQALKALEPIKGIGFGGAPGVDANGLGKGRMFVYITK